RDALGAREDVVADARVRIALHLVEEQGRAAVEVLLDRGDLEGGIDPGGGGDQLAGGLQVREGRPKARDVLLHRTRPPIGLLPGGDTAPRALAPSRALRRARRGSAG